MKPALQQRQSQQLVMTPQLQQSIRLLQLSTQEINQEVARLLDENPLLEREEDGATQHYADSNSASSSSSTEEKNARDAAQDEMDTRQDSEEWGEPAFAAHVHDEDDERQSEVAAEMPTLREHLLWQLNMSQFDARDKKIIGLLVDALDENGYLAQPLEEIAELLPAELDITLDDLETALAQLQHLDEPGLGARSLSECLALQIKAMPEDTPGRGLALSLVTQHLALLGAHDFTKLKKLLQCDDAGLRVVQALIMHLNPKPGEKYEARTADHVVPEVIVEQRGKEWRVRLNPEAMPRLRVNQVYASILQQRGEKNAQQLAGQLQEARWFIKNLQQRFDTILRVAQAIVGRQRQFLELGEVAMRPLVLREIAEELELHESTISRVTTQKFMRTPRGIYEFKYFFSSGLAAEAGGEHSSTAVRAVIKQLVGEEDQRQPLSDSRISEILAQQGITVARRTVAKYRELMNILPANLRKSL
jgi:RNA polymerase sigma-54 factor